MSMTFPDKVKITPITIDETYRTETPGVPFTTEAAVEEDGSIKYSSAGEPIDPEIWIFLPGNVSIERGDYIQITELHGETPTAQEAEERKVKRYHRAGGFSISHIEVLV